MQKTTSKRRKQREPFGRIRQLRSGRWQAAYTGPDLALHKAAATFPTILDARGWLHEERKLIDAGTWRPPTDRNRRDDATMTLAAYWEPWIADRPLKPSTKQLYEGTWTNHINRPLGGLSLRTISPATIRRWHADLDTGPTAKAHAYSLLRTILASAVEDELIPANPCHIRGAGVSKRVRKIQPATVPEIGKLIEALPDRYGALVLIGAWCGLRWGEMTELRRGDLDLKAKIIHVRRGVTRVQGRHVVGPPKSEAGIRDVAIPPHIVPALRAHLGQWAAPGADGLLFPAPGHGGHLEHSTVWEYWDVARKAAGRPDLRIHDLRHSQAVMAAATGATLAELMQRLGHSTPAMAMRYQHAAKDRDSEIAMMLSTMARSAK